MCLQNEIKALKNMGDFDRIPGERSQSHGLQVCPACGTTPSHFRTTAGGYKVCRNCNRSHWPGSTLAKRKVNTGFYRGEPLYLINQPEKAFGELRIASPLTVTTDTRLARQHAGSLFTFDPADIDPESFRIVWLGNKVAQLILLAPWSSLKVFRFTSIVAATAFWRRTEGVAKMLALIALAEERLREGRKTT